MLIRPLFPGGYIFCRFDYERREEVLSTPGVLDIVMCDGKPGIVPDAQIEQIREMEAAGAQPAAFKPGALVEVRVGSAIVEGVLQRMKNAWSVLVTISMMGKTLSVPCDVEDVRAA